MNSPQQTSVFTTRRKKQDGSTKPILLAVEEGRIYHYQIQERGYRYVIDGALYNQFRALYNKSHWKAFNFVKKNSIEWEKVTP